MNYTQDSSQLAIRDHQALDYLYGTTTSCLIDSAKLLFNRFKQESHLIKTNSLVVSEHTPFGITLHLKIIYHEPITNSIAGVYNHDTHTITIYFSCFDVHGHLETIEHIIYERFSDFLLLAFQDLDLTESLGPLLKSFVKLESKHRIDYLDFISHLAGYCNTLPKLLFVEMLGESYLKPTGNHSVASKLQKLAYIESDDYMNDFRKEDLRQAHTWQIVKAQLPERLVTFMFRLLFEFLERQATELDNYL